eukprot:g2244.t1
MGCFQTKNITLDPSSTIEGKSEISLPSGEESSKSSELNLNVALAKSLSEEARSLAKTWKSSRDMSNRSARSSERESEKLHKTVKGDIKLVTSSGVNLHVGTEYDTFVSNLRNKFRNELMKLRNSSLTSGGRSFTSSNQLLDNLLVRALESNETETNIVDCSLSVDESKSIYEAVVEAEPDVSKLSLVSHCLSISFSPPTTYSLRDQTFYKGILAHTPDPVKLPYIIFDDIAQIALVMLLCMANKSKDYETFVAMQILDEKDYVDKIVHSIFCAALLAKDAKLQNLHDGTGVQKTKSRTTPVFPATVLNNLLKLVQHIVIADEKGKSLLIETGCEESLISLRATIHNQTTCQEIDEVLYLFAKGDANDESKMRYDHYMEALYREFEGKVPCPIDLNKLAEIREPLQPLHSNEDKDMPPALPPKREFTKTEEHEKEEEDEKETCITGKEKQEDVYEKKQDTEQINEDKEKEEKEDHDDNEKETIETEVPSLPPKPKRPMSHLMEDVNTNRDSVGTQLAKQNDQLKIAMKNMMEKKKRTLSVKEKIAMFESKSE